MSELFTKVLLDRPWRIRFSNRSIYKVQTLERPLELREIDNPLRRIAAVSQWLWACLDEENPFDTPEKLADVIDINRLGEITQALVDCILLDQPRKDEKKEVSSTL